MSEPPENRGFRAEAHRMVDWIADYLDGGAHRYPVLSNSSPGDLRQVLPADMPSDPEDLQEIWQDFQSIVLPGVTHWNHPGFMAYFGITGSGPGILGEMLSAALNVNGMLWRTCPAATELELVVLDWLRRGLDLPGSFFGFLCDTASISSLLALAAAREYADIDVRERGLASRPDLPPLRVYASDQAHSSIAKACLTLGLGLEGFRAIPHDTDYRMNVAALREAIAEDRRGGYRPLAVVATVGTTSTTSVDPIPEIAQVCGDENLWLHVDAQPLLERAAPAPFSVVCFRAVPTGMKRGEALDGLNRQLMEEINASGEIYLSHTRLDDGIALRVAIGNLGTDSTDLERCRTLILKGLQCLSNP